MALHSKRNFAKTNLKKDAATTPKPSEQNNIELDKL